MKTFISFLKKYNYLVVSMVFLLAFIIFTILVKTVDVYYYYNNTYIGFYSMNYAFGEFVTHFGKYASMKKASDILLYLSFGYILVLFIFALIELIKKKSFKKLNKNYYLALGGYISVAIIYFIFEVAKVNYSPDSIAGDLKASYPSTHVFVGSMFYLINTYTALKLLKPEKEWISPLVYIATGIICLLIVFTRALSAKHWLSDIIASILLIISVYTAFTYVSHKLIPIERVEALKEEIE